LWLDFDKCAGNDGGSEVTYDNFTLLSTDNIVRVRWVGGRLDQTPGVGTLTGFTVQFFEDNSGLPGGSVSPVFEAGYSPETFLGLLDVGTTIERSVFSYSMPVNFTATGGTQYWLSVVANSTCPGFPGSACLPPRWIWQGGTGGDGIAYFDFSVPGGGTSRFSATDVAFELNSVPEPVSMSLVGSGF